MKENKKYIWEITKTIVVFSLLFTSFSEASLMLRQPSVKLSLAQGEKHSGGIILENTADQPLNVKVALSDDPDPKGKTVERACSKWITLQETSFQIAPKSVKDLRYTVVVPKNAKGGYWTGVVYSYFGGTMNPTGDMNVNINMNVEMPINIAVIDTLDNKLTVKDMTYSYDKSNKDLKLAVVLKNDGNVFQTVTSYFVVKDSKGKVIKEDKGPSIKIYPPNEKSFEQKEKIELSKGAYALQAIFDYDHGKVKTIDKVLNIDQ